MSKPLPPWLIPPSRKLPHLRALGRQLAEMGVNTVCQSARCPNLGECFARRTATFLIMGNVCTRNCRFCAVDHGTPAPLDPAEPSRVAEAAHMLGLRYVVVTSVTRDDLADGGAAHFAATIAALRDFLPPARVEVLVPDFQGDRASVAVLARAGPEVFGHNIETVPRLYPQVRPQAGYARSLAILRMARDLSAAMVIKSGFMVGLGESGDEVLGLLHDLREAGVSAVTIGQYLQPTPTHLPVVSYLPPETFRLYQQSARALGFAHVLSGPLVRSSYHAEELVSPQTRGGE